MNLSLEKKLLKEQIDSINDADVLEAIKKLIGFAFQGSHKRLTKEELVARALESEKAIAENRVTSLEDLEKEISNW
jgi:hypothetical protein